jgi:tol-pal system protein YbgF
MRRDINTLQNQIDDLQQDIAGLKSPGSSEAVVTFEGRKGQADMEAELERLRIDLNNVNARIEDSQYLTTRLSGRLDSLETNLSTRIDGLEAKLDRAMAMGETTETARSEPQPAVREVKTPPPAVVEPPDAETAPAREPSDVERMYREAYQTFQAGNLDDAKRKFASFLEKYPDTPLSDNAQFWIGEISFKRHQYEAAILAYEDVIKKYPDSNKLPDAILKQGLAFLELGDRIDARIVLENLVKKYPNTEQARAAQDKLKTLQ